MIRTFSKRRVALVALLAAASGTALTQAQAQPQAPATPPRYRVELIVFANGNFSPGEELFDEREAPLAVPEIQVFDDEWLQAQLEAAERAANGDVANAANGANNASGAQPPSSDAGADGTLPSPGAMPPLEPEPRFRLLTPEELELTPQYQRLAARGTWRPILHGGWIQEVVSENRSEPVRLSVFGVHNPAGTITLYRNNFVHLRLDVSYQDSLGGSFASAEQAAGGFGLEPFALAPRYRLEQSRQTRSGQLQHFDHPAFGVLVKVTEIPRTATPSGAQRAEP